MEDSSSCEQHIPEVDLCPLEVDDKAYSLLEHLTLEWPTQTVCFINSEILLLGTNPDINNYNNASIYSLDFTKTNDYTDLNKFTSKKIYPSFINRIRKNDTDLINKFIAVSDKSLYLFNNNELIKEYNGDTLLDYGIAINSNYICYSENGNINIIDINSFNKINNNQLHYKNINDIVLENNLIFSASNDFSIKTFDIRSNEIIFNETFNCDVNSIDSNKENKLICGLENGEIKIFDKRNGKIEKTLQWHKSAITSLKFYSNEEFYSSSFEKCCLWDLDLEEIENWEYPNELIFEHSGDKNYKDMCINNNTGESPVFATCGEEWVCLFSPIE